MTPARTWTPRTTTPKSSPTVSKAPASTSVPGAGNPDIIETLPNTANEMDIKPEIESESSPLPGLESPEQSVQGTDWSKSYHGLSSQAFSKDIAEVLLAPIEPLDVEMKPGA